MKTLDDHLSNYASYHRDRRNIVTHFVGIPMITVAIAALLARASFEVSGVTFTAAHVVGALICAFYFALDLRFALAMSAVMAASIALGGVIASLPFTPFLYGAGGLFVAGWAIQFAGHFYEGKKPAFVDDIVGLLIGPLFLVAEAAFALGLRDEVRREIERRAGPTHGPKATTPASR
jgi:uncharacterized membrane protein YGL010W